MEWADPAGPARMDDATREHYARTFDRAAELYERARPSFADAAIDWVLPAGAARVLDLGAGTGKLTASLVDRGLDVVAIDPSPNMLAQLSAKLPDVDARIGSAEAIDLPDAGVDAIFVGSAFHWFARPAADREMARVLRPGGRVGLMWNLRDPASPTARAFEQAPRDYQSSPERNSEAAELAADWFTPTERRDFPHQQVLTPERFVELVASRSYVIAMPDAERTGYLDRVREYVRTEPELAGRTEFSLGYLTVVRRSTRR